MQDEVITAVDAAEGLPESQDTSSTRSCSSPIHRGRSDSEQDQAMHGEATFALPNDFADRLRAVLAARAQPDGAPALDTQTGASREATAPTRISGLPDNLLTVKVLDASITSTTDGLILGIPSSTILIPAPPSKAAIEDDDDDIDWPADIDSFDIVSSCKGNVQGAFRGAALSRATLDTALVLGGIIDSSGLSLADWIISLDPGGDTVTFARPPATASSGDMSAISKLCTPAAGTVAQQLVGLRMPVQAAEELLSMQAKHEEQRQAMSHGILGALGTSMGAEVEAGGQYGDAGMSGTALGSITQGIQLLVASQVKGVAEKAGSADKAVKSATRGVMMVAADGADHSKFAAPLKLGD